MQTRGHTRPAAWEAVDVRGQEKLYAAYSELHRVAQKTHIPINAPVVTVVGHQTDGKSALMEALMGFQFNHVGGGTKTRRPVKIEMVYDENADIPQCFLARTDGDQEMSLEELKAYIESENVRLGSENRFDPTDIIIQIRYKHCPNLTMIDTPGLMSIPCSSENTELKQASQQVEEIVRQKISQPESINLCLEDNSDWINATTRRVVLQIDPHLERTVLVSTKFDSRIGQFATSADVEAFLHPSTDELCSASMLGDAPFFTSVPSGRVGDDAESTFSSCDALYSYFSQEPLLCIDFELRDEDFQMRIVQQEAEDQRNVQAKLRKALTRGERSHIGVSNLRKFLEVELLQRYKEHITPITRYVDDRTYKLKREQEAVESAKENLAESEVKVCLALYMVEDSVTDLKCFTLAAAARSLRLQDHVRRVLLAVLKQNSNLLSGDACLPDETQYGQSLQQEWEEEGQLQCTSGFRFNGGDGGWEQHAKDKFGDRQLYGGAQYFRALDEFREFVGGIQCPDISDAEMDNKCGLGTRTDAPNITSVAAQLAADKAKRAFEPLLLQLGQRAKHVLRRLIQMSCDPAFQAMDGSILDCIQGYYTQFIEDHELQARNSALEDLKSRTHFVTLGRSDAALREAVRCDVNDEEVNRVIHAHHEDARDILTNLLRSHVSTLFSQPRGQIVQESVPELTKSLFISIRDGFVGDTVRKFNYKLLLQLQEGLTEYLQKQLDAEDIGALCNIKEIHEELQEKHHMLAVEVENMEHLKTTFGAIKKLLRKGNATAAS